MGGRRTAAGCCSTGLSFIGTLADLGSLTHPANWRPHRTSHRCCPGSSGPRTGDVTNGFRQGRADAPVTGAAVTHPTAGSSKADAALGITVSWWTHRDRSPDHEASPVRGRHPDPRRHHPRTPGRRPAARPRFSPTTHSLSSTTCSPASATPPSHWPRPAPPADTGRSRIPAGEYLSSGSVDRRAAPAE